MNDRPERGLAILQCFKVGDNVTAKYYAGFVAELRKPTPEEEKEPLVVLEGAGRAATSAAPAGGGVRRIKAVVTIEGLDRPTETITVRGLLAVITWRTWLIRKI